MVTRRPATPPTAQEVKASLTAAATENLKIALETDLTADAIVRRVAEITVPTSAATKAGEAGTMAGSAKAAVVAFHTAWTAFEAATDVNDVQTEAIKMGGKAAEASTFIAQATKTLEEAETLAREIKTDKELVDETIQFRIDVGNAEDAILDIAKQVGEAHRSARTAESEAAVATLATLKSEVATEFTNARRAEDDAKAAVARPDIERAHTHARRAKTEAESKKQSAEDAQRAVNRADPPTPPSLTPRGKAKESVWGWLKPRAWPYGALVGAVIAIAIAAMAGLPSWLPVEWIVTIALFVIPVVAFLVARPIHEGTHDALPGQAAAFLLAAIGFGLVIIAFRFDGGDDNVKGKGTGPDGETIQVIVGGGTPMAMWVILAMLTLIIVAAIAVAAVLYRRRTP